MKLGGAGGAGSGGSGRRVGVRAGVEVQSSFVMRCHAPAGLPLQFYSEMDCRQGGGAGLGLLPSFFTAQSARCGGPASSPRQLRVDLEYCQYPNC